MKRRGPDFLLVGGARCGTTTLYSWLREHPSVFMPAFKEPSYFLPYRVGYGVKGEKEYYALFTGSGNRVVGEASTAYLAEPGTPERIQRELGDVRIIILLRDPVARAFSSWRWMAGQGLEPIRSFEEAVAAEEPRAADPRSVAGFRQSIWDYLYVRSGFYARQVEAYLERFSNVLVLRFDDVVNDPRPLFGRVCQFLGIPGTENAPRQENGTGIPRWWTGQMRARRVLQALDDRNPPGRRLLERGVWKAMSVNRRTGPTVRLSPATASRLRDGYVHDLARTSAMTGLDLTAWTGTPPALPAPLPTAEAGDAVGGRGVGLEKVLELHVSAGQRIDDEQ